MPENYHFADLTTISTSQQDIHKDEMYARALQAALQREAYAAEVRSYNHNTGANRDHAVAPTQPSNINSMMEDGLIDGLEIDLGSAACACVSTHPLTSLQLHQDVHHKTRAEREGVLSWNVGPVHMSMLYQGCWLRIPNVC
mmetsp:Transcript_19692/g.65582  ORF Transcript_19692/g.65582 Transcript_19692/m.65582 type:complete len:141 (-) Transcript_19692:1051-1473(-)